MTPLFRPLWCWAGPASFSSTVTRTPARARCSAALAPMAPAPITMTSGDTSVVAGSDVREGLVDSALRLLPSVPDAHDSAVLPDAQTAFPVMPVPRVANQCTSRLSAWLVDF